MDAIPAEVPQPAVGPDAEVTVPVWLAGGIDTRPVFDALEAWTVIDGTAGHVIVEHPARGVRVGFLPERPDGYDPDALWEITAYADPGDTRPMWKTTFGDHTPAEAIIAFIVAVTAPAGVLRHPDELPRHSRR
ncbi:DUF317 domain-containing protein [Yinghuangia seranimata]|uniref:DUF317 domain-containing protein n=1 Tax=Yinghuangia seranimata TaxID=408067 RepID=UPI00248AE44C|nr:DUF317 domain-containing protein [Yinghuangia seranimata]MDI2127117.1 DUF317 domain-containing protein [Yinghuangia seranimata]